MNVPRFRMKNKTLLDQVLGLEHLRTEYMRSSGTDLPDDLMLSVLAKCLPKARQQHVQLQLTESATYSQVRAMVIGYERTTMTWSPGKIHSELGIFIQPQFFFFPPHLFPHEVQFSLLTVLYWPVSRYA